jgi:hypothetical protein
MAGLSRGGIANPLGKTLVPVIGGGGTGAGVYVSKTSFLSSASTNSLIAVLTSDFGLGTTYQLVGTVPPQINLISNNIVVGSTAPVAGGDYKVKVRATSANGESETARTFVFHADADTSQPTIFISDAIARPEGNSGNNFFTYTVTRSTTVGNLLVTWSFAAGATDASDFVGGLPVGGQITIPNGSNIGTITIAVQPDADLESNESFTVAVSVPAGYVAGGALSATGTILNDDFDTGGLPAIFPANSWNGTEGTGFTTNAAPVDPARTTAKPALRLMTPPNERFTENLVVGLASMANNNGTTIGGVAKVIVHCEGTQTEITAPSYRTITDANGVARTYFGWWATLLHSAFSMNGHARVYYEAVPADTTMQSRVMGPYSYTRHTVKHDLEVTVGATGATYTTLLAALTAVRNANAENARITLTSPGPFTFAITGGSWNAKNYVTIDATVPATIGYSSYTNDAAAYGRTRMDGLWFKGSNITLDMSYMIDVYHDGGERQHRLDGCTIVNKLGRTGLWRKGQRVVGTVVRGAPWFTEAKIIGMNDPVQGASLVRGCDIKLATRDITSNALCVINTTCTNHDSEFWNSDVPAFTITYTGAASTATFKLAGANEQTRTFTLTTDGVDANFTILNSDAASTANTNYTVQNVVDFVNSQTGWSATLSPNGNDRRASALSLVGLKGIAFGATNAKNVIVQLVTMFDAHGDAYQQDIAFENIIIDGYRGIETAGQNIFLTGNGTGTVNKLWDAFFVNNTYLDKFGNVLTYNLWSNRSSQLSNPHSHVVIAHNTMPRQGLSLNNHLTTAYKYLADKYCLIANNSFRFITLGTPGTAVSNLVIKDNHVISGGSPLGATGTVQSGTETSLYFNTLDGILYPTNELLADVKTPTVLHTRGGNLRTGPVPVGSHSIANPVQPLPYVLLNGFETLGSATAAAADLTIDSTSRKAQGSGAYNIVGNGTSASHTVSGLPTFTNDLSANNAVIVMSVDLDSLPECQLGIVRLDFTSGGQTYVYKSAPEANPANPTSTVSSSPWHADSRGRAWISYNIDNFRITNWSGASLKTVAATATKSPRVLSTDLTGNFSSNVTIDAMAVPAFHKPCVVITYDDVNATQYTDIFPAMQSRGLVASFYVCYNLIGTGSKWTLAQGDIMHAAGFDMAVDSETVDLPMTAFATRAEAMAALNYNRDQILARWGNVDAAKHVCFSYGKYGQTIASYTGTCTADGTTTVSVPSPSGFVSVIPGMRVFGTNVPEGTYVVKPISQTRVLLSQPIPTGSVSLTFVARKIGVAITATGTTTVTVDSSANLFVGMTMLGYKVPADTKITAINSSTSITLSNPILAATVKANFAIVDHDFWHTKVLDDMLTAGYRTGRVNRGSGVIGYYTGYGLDPKFAMNMGGMALDSILDLNNASLTQAQIDASLVETNRINATVEMLVRDRQDVILYGHSHTNTAHYQMFLDKLVSLRDAGLCDVVTLSEWYRRASARAPMV